MRTDGSHICDMSGAACRDWKRAVATADIHSSRESPVSLDAAGRHVITDAKIPEVLGSHRAVPGRQRGDALQTAVSYMRETANIPGQRRRSRTCSATGAWGGSPLARDERVELRGARRTPPDPEGPPGARGTTRDGCVVARRQAGTFAGGRRDKAVDCSPSPPAAAGLRETVGRRSAPFRPPDESGFPPPPPRQLRALPTVPGAHRWQTAPLTRLPMGGSAPPPCCRPGARRKGKGLRTGLARLRDYNTMGLCECNAWVLHS